MENLERLWLANHNIAGQIPASLSRLTELDFFAIEDKDLRGRIPLLLGSLTKLTALRLSDNQLMGHIPSSLGNLRKLTWLELGGNDLIGCIPPRLRRIPNNDLDSLRLDACQYQPFARDPGQDFNGLSENGDPTGIWSKGTTIWVADYRDEKVYAYQLANGERVPTETFATLVLQSQVVLGRMRLLYQLGEVRNWPGSGERCWKRPGGPRVLRKCTDALVHVSTGRNPADGHWPM